MYRTVVILMMTLLLAGSANACVMVGFSPDGSGAPPHQDVIGFDWLPGNSLAIGGNVATATFLNTGTAVGIDAERGIWEFRGGTQTVYDVVFQAKLEAIQLVGGGTAAPGDEITLVIGFQEQIISRMGRRARTSRRIRYPPNRKR
jgi:hypothetical protein